VNAYAEVPWDTFTQSFRWRQGEHLLIVKPTGGGKTTLLANLLPFQKAPAQVVFVTKVYDATITKQFSKKDGWYRVEKWPPPRYADKVLLWPRAGKTITETLEIQRRVFLDALDSIFQERGWTVVFDEEHYLCSELGLSKEVAMYHHQGRSSGLTVVDGIQRPKYVPLITFSSATHAFIGNTTDRDDLKRLADLGGVDAKQLQAEAMVLDFYEFIYVPARVRGRVPVRTTVNLKRT
jgi:hypothetical protein